MTGEAMNPLLQVRDLSVRFCAKEVVRGVGFDIAPGEKLALVGESGSGKTITALSLLRLAGEAKISGQAMLRGRDLLSLSEREMRGVRGGEIAMVFQEPMTALNPLMTIGQQIAEVLELKKALTPAESAQSAIELLAKTGIPEPGRRANSFPHQLSGGQRQRAMIAMALASEPALLLADEPTTALDVSIQAQIIALLKRLCREHGTAVMLVTHDMGVIAETADRVAVMYAGRIAEIGPVRDVVKHAKHPYTKGLMGSIPSLGVRTERLTQIDGAMPRLTEIPTGCAFNPRCLERGQRCLVERPDLMAAGTSRAACWLHDRGGIGAPVLKETVDA